MPQVKKPTNENPDLALGQTIAKAKMLKLRKPFTLSSESAKNLAAILSSPLTAGAVEELEHAIRRFQTEIYTLDSKFERSEHEFKLLHSIAKCLEDLECGKLPPPALILELQYPTIKSITKIVINHKDIINKILTHDTLEVAEMSALVKALYAAARNIKPRGSTRGNNQKETIAARHLKAHIDKMYLHAFGKKPPVYTMNQPYESKAKDLLVAVAGIATEQFEKSAQPEYERLLRNLSTIERVKES